MPFLSVATLRKHVGKKARLEADCIVLDESSNMTIEEVPLNWVFLRAPAPLPLKS